MDVTLPEKNYLVMEMISKDREAGSLNLEYIYIVEFTKERIVLGRGRSCDIRIEDISVSRMHSVLVFENGNFYIEDNNSKFGTLVALNEPFSLSSGQ